MAAMVWVTMYAIASFHAKRLAVASPMVTAGLKCPPEMCPNAYTPPSTVRPKASAMPTSPMPVANTVGVSPPAVTAGANSFAASTALPQPPRTRTKVPRNSAPSRRTVA